MKTCPKCDSEMEHGFQVDGVDRASYRQSQWAPGPPEAANSPSMKSGESSNRQTADMSCGSQIGAFPNGQN